VIATPAFQANDSRDTTYLNSAVAGQPPSRSTFKPALDATGPLPSSPHISAVNGQVRATGALSFPRSWLTSLR
jgi:hypothetical protein